jgi:hypothetical protein
MIARINPAIGRKRLRGIDFRGLGGLMETMEIFSLRALWKGLRGRSLTFSVIFAMAWMGSSFAGILRLPLRMIGLWAPLIFILPVVATILLARHERRLPWSDDFKRVCNYTLIFGAILLSLLLWRYEAWLRSSYADSVVPGPRYREVDKPEIHRSGPRGRP